METTNTKASPMLTTLEQQAFAELVNVANGNGLDFGIVEEVVWSDRQALGALITSLQEKGLIEMHPTMYVNEQKKFRRDKRAPGGFREIRSGGNPVTQYTFTEAGLIAAKVA